MPDGLRLDFLFFITYKNVISKTLIASMNSMINEKRVKLRRVYIWAILKI